MWITNSRKGGGTEYWNVYCPVSNEYTLRHTVASKEAYCFKKNSEKGITS